jgi:hypothetical protein
MKLSIMRNYGLKARFLKIENGDNSEFQELKGWTDINCQTMWVVECTLHDSLKLKHKMKL